MNFYVKKLVHNVLYAISMIIAQGNGLYQFSLRTHSPIPIEFFGLS